VGGKGGGGSRGEKWSKPCMHIWVIKEKKILARFFLKTIYWIISCNITKVLRNSYTIVSILCLKNLNYGRCPKLKTNIVHDWHMNMVWKLRLQYVFPS
jgi:hypothetical protein